MQNNKKHNPELLNHITVRHKNEKVEFVYLSEQKKDAKKTFHQLCHHFDGAGYNPCVINDENGNQLAKLISVYTGKKAKSALGDFWGGLFLGATVTALIVICIL